jgi:hypothetical protein
MVLSWAKKSRFPGILYLLEPSSGLEPETPLYEEGPCVKRRLSVSPS